MSNLEHPVRAVLCETAYVHRVGPSGLHWGGEFEVKPVLFSVIRTRVDRPPVFPLVHKPCEVRAFALPPDGFRDLLLAIGRIVGARDGVSFRARGGDDIKRISEHLFGTTRFAALVMLHVAVVEVQHEDAFGERLEINQVGSRCVRRHPEEE